MLAYRPALRPKGNPFGILRGRLSVQQANDISEWDMYPAGYSKGFPLAPAPFGVAFLHGGKRKGSPWEYRKVVRAHRVCPNMRFVHTVCPTEQSCPPAGDPLRFPPACFQGDRKKTPLNSYNFFIHHAIEKVMKTSSTSIAIFCMRNVAIRAQCFLMRSKGI
jgi:hypothetical protein